MDKTSRQRASTKSVWGDALPSKEGYYWLRYKGKGRRRWEGPFIAWVKKCDGTRKDCLSFQFASTGLGVGIVGECGDMLDCEQWAGPLSELEE